jgi:ribosomal protein S18 acetylase RimI-like enzyme
MLDIHLLDNPIWSSLTTVHSSFATGSGLARSYLQEIGPLSGLAEESSAAYEDLRAQANPGAVQVLFLDQPPVPKSGWTLIRGGQLTQMVYAGRGIEESAEPSGMRVLTPADVPAMVELATLTEPGPFRHRTHELGVFFGIFEGDRLLAMAGQRMRVAGFVEVSAVCTHPDARGRGYARTLMSSVMKLILREGDTPFLHSFADNHSAIRVYNALGFTHRRAFHLEVLKRDS